MNQKEMLFANFIADLVVEKLHNNFAFKLMDKDLSINDEIGMDEKISIEDLLNGELKLEDDMEEKLFGELARLTTLLTLYEDKEEYKKATIIKNKIKEINKKIDKL